MTAPDYVSPIVGYRVWLCDGGGLKSLTGEPWFPNRPIVAACNAITVGTIANGTRGAHNPKDAPQAQCTCGVYAAKSLAHLRSAGYWRYGIRGEVNLWGTVEEHELGWRAQFAYPKVLFLPHDTLPLTFAAMQSRLKALIVYGVDIFIAGPKEGIPMWTKDSGYDSAGLDYLLKRSKQYCDRRRQEQILKTGDRVALLALGIGVVEQVDGNDVHLMLGNRHRLKISRKHVAWDRQNTRWEMRLAAVFQERWEKSSRIRGPVTKGHSQITLPN